MRKFTLILIILLLLSSCSSTPETELVGDPLKFIEDYIISAVPGIHFVDVGFSDNHEIYIFAYLHDDLAWYFFGEKAWTAYDAAKLATTKTGYKIRLYKISICNESGEYISWGTNNLKNGDLTLAYNNNYKEKGIYTLKQLSKEYSPTNKEAVLEEFESLKNLLETTTYSSPAD